MKLRKSTAYLAISVSYLVGCNAWAVCESPNPDNETKTVSFTYDANDMLSTETVEPGQSGECANRLTLTTTHRYDQVGNQYLKYSTGWDGVSVVNRATVVKFDGARRFAVSKYITDNVNVLPDDAIPSNVLLVEYFVTDGRTGELLKKTGANGEWTQHEFDPYGRKTRSLASNGAFEDVSYTTFQTVDPVYGTHSWNTSVSLPPNYGATKPSWKTTSTSVAAGTAIKPAKVTYFDGAGREIASETQHSNVGSFTYVQQQYNSYGQVVRLSKPQFVGQDPAYWVNYDYYGDGRLFHEQLPDANGQNVISSFFYDGRSSTKIDPLGAFKTSVVNERGEVVSTAAPLGAFLQYLYSAAGNLVATVDPYGSKTSITYDVRGRKTAMSDPNKGVWSYGYNAFGEQIQQTDPNGRIAKITYDKFGRQIQKTYSADPSQPSEATMDARWVYGDAAPTPCSNGIGRLCFAFTVSGTAGSVDPQTGLTGNSTIQYVRKHSYAISGEVTQTETKVGDSRVFAMNSAYDAYGRLTEFKYPSLDPTNSAGKRLGLNYVYSNNGYLLSVSAFDTSAGNGSWRVWQLNTAAPDLQAMYEVLGPFSGPGMREVDILSVPDLSNGRITSRQTTVAGANTTVTLLDRLNYVYDVVGNLRQRSRQDPTSAVSSSSSTISEILQPDALERLVGWTYIQNGVSKTVALEYLANGNIHYKGDFGFYAYGPNYGVPDPNSGKPHAVKSVFMNGTSRSFNYDASGNMISEVGPSTRSLEYTSWGMVRKIQVDGDGSMRKSEFAFGPELQRVQQISNTQGKTLYLNGADSLGLAFEQVTDLTGVISYKHYVQAGGRASLAITIPASNYQSDISSTASNRFEYLHYDHLGSLVMSTAKDGSVVEKFFWDPWGKRLNVNSGTNYGEYENRPLPNGVTAIASMDRGFTMHEHLDELGYIHMNGRIYDPTLARFPQADPFVPDATHLQAYNRYSYVYNNPLRYSDPTGYKPFWEMRWFKRDFLPFAAIAASLLLPQFLPEALPESMSYTYTGMDGEAVKLGLNPIGKAVVGATTAATATLLASGGNVDSSLKAALTGGLFGFVGGVGYENSWAYSVGGQITFIAAHAAVGCLDGAMTHSGCGRGAVSAAFGKFTTLNIPAYIGNNAAAVGAATVVAGGLGSVIGGGKFLSGARTSLMGYLFNQVMSEASNRAALQKGTCTSPSIACAAQNAAFNAAYESGIKAQGIERVVVEDWAVFGVGNGARKSGLSFFEGAYYTDKVLTQAASGDLRHGFSQAIDGFAAAFGTTSSRVGGDGRVYQWLTVRGEYRGQAGIFEYTKGAGGSINHRMFKPD